MSKKIKNLIKETLKESFNENYNFYNGAKISEKDSRDHMFSEINEDNKSKIRNLIIRLLNRRDEIDFNLTERHLTLNTPYEDQWQKMPPSSTRYSHPKSNKIYFHIEIIKETGFVINCNEKKIMMKDPTLFDEMVPKAKEIFDKINQENFSDLYNFVMKENGLIRESNLDDLLSRF